ncbi:MAG: B12-binding domain-containing radical SAM protein [Acidobacteria bacterium]|nr:B12-binding domain-containing radical SAM protein [Acidobacteriota bacterium]
MRIAIIATYTHPTRLPAKERTIQHSSAPELIAGLCPEDVDIEIYNEKEEDIPLDRDWDLVFFSYLHAFYEHTKVLSTLFRQRGMITVAGGRHASYFPEDAQKHFDAVAIGEPEANVPAIIEDFKHKKLKGVYNLPSPGPCSIRPYRWNLLNFKRTRVKLAGIEASRGCPFACNFCVLTGNERYRYRPIPDVISDIRDHMTWNKNLFGVMDNAFKFLDNNLGGSPEYLRELCEALIPLHKIWGCALTFNILRDSSLVKLMARAGCRFIYTGLESLNPESIASMNKRQNKLAELDSVMRLAYSSGILLSFGLLVGADGDTNEYLEKLPQYIADLGWCAVTFVGIVCPYPETPFFRHVEAEKRLLPGTISRDYDSYTVCHRPKKLDPSEVAEHYVRLSRKLGSLPMVLRHYRSTFFLSDIPRYKSTILVSGSEILSLRNPVRNPSRTYIAGRDPIEEWDQRQMAALGLQPQRLT